MSTTFAFFPYWKTSRPIHFQCVTYRDIGDLSGRPPELAEHLKALSTMFFLRDNSKIQRFIYTTLPSEPADRAQIWLERIECFATVWKYLYSSPDQRTGAPWLSIENGTCYRLTPMEIPTTLVTDQTNVEVVADCPPLLNPKEVGWFIPGYQGETDHSDPFFAVPGSRIYPPTPSLWLREKLDLFEDDRTLQPEPNGALSRFMRTAPLDDRFARRLLTALRWYNRAAAGNRHSSDLHLVHLAIAFESLFGLPRNDKVTERFKDAVKLLIGPIPRLNSFLAQFYDARSALMHDGHVADLMFRATDLAEGTSFGKKDLEKAAQHRSLIVYGRRIFRMCVPALVHGYEAAQRDGLGALLETNVERLEKMCAVLNDDSKRPQERLSDAAEISRVVVEFKFSESNVPPLSTLIAAAKGAAAAFLELRVSLPTEALAAINALATVSSKGSDLDVMQTVERAIDAIQPQRADRLSAIEYLDSVLDSVWEYINLPLINARAKRPAHDDGRAEP